MKPAGRTSRIREHAEACGLGRFGIVREPVSGHLGAFRDWLGAGLHGQMSYLAREDAVRRRGDLRLTMPDFRSAVVVAENYFQTDPEGVPDDPALGVIARYARGRDYHKVLLRKLQALGRRLEEEFGAASRAYVDTGPILERDLGRRAGLGWFGKNTMLLHPERGSYFFLGVLLTDLELESSDPFEGEHCGSCTRCLEACPTDALLGYDEDGAPIMDAARCISYLTIEHRGPIPEELRPLMGNRVFGCDICQEVCPWNRKFAEESAEPGYAARGPGERPTGVQALPGERAVEADARGGGRGDSAETPEDVSAETRRLGNPAHPGTYAPSLGELMRMTREDWDAFTRGSAIRRAGYAGFRRNVAVAMGNWLASVEGELPEEAVAVLREALEDESELVREHAAWALERAGAEGGLT